MQLTGPPRLAGIVRAYASSEGPVQDVWEDRSVYLQGRTRSRRKGARRLWPSWSLRFVGTGAEWLAFRSDLIGDGAGEFDWSPRTRMPEDPEWLAEHVYRARVVGGLPTLSELRRQFSSGEHAYVVDVEIEGVEPYEREPDASVGYYSVAEAGGERTLYAHAGATLTRDDGEAVTLRDGSVVTVHTLTLGPPATAGRYVQRDGLDLLIQTRD